MTPGEKLKELKKRQAEQARKLREAERLAGKKGPGYQSFRESQAAISRQKSAEGRDIGPPPPVLDPVRKEACRLDLKLFGTTYFARRLWWPWSQSHVEDLDTLQRCILSGGLFAYSRPRGEGKTTEAEIAALWATLYGHRRYVLIVAANQKPLAEDILESLQKEVQQNDLLFDDFPEVCHPFRELEGINGRAKGQTIRGVRTLLSLTGDIVFPRVEGSAASGSIIEAVGMEAAIRGRKKTLPDGETVRPDFVIGDDPQDRASAKSPTQTATRMSIIKGDILGLARADTPIAVVIPCTPIYPNDLADQLLNRDLNPQWQGRRTKRLVKWPTDLDLWKDYAEVRANGLRAGDGGRAANEFYVAHRAALDAGAEVSWVDRIKRGDVSAIQGAMNRWLDDPDEFFAEDQCDPVKQALGSAIKEYNPKALAQRTSGLPRGVVPEWATHLTAFVDCGTASLMWWAICAWGDGFRGVVIDYQAWPHQSRTNFAARDAHPTMKDRYKGMSDGQMVYAGLSEILPLIERSYPVIGGRSMDLHMVLIDSGWESKAVYEFIQASPMRTRLRPSKGKARSKTQSAVGRWLRRPGEKAGHHWRQTKGEYGKTPLVQFDADEWKSILHTILHLPPGGSAGLRFFGDEPGAHAMIADHCECEYSDLEEHDGGTFDKWRKRPGRADNHWLDCLVGCAVAASVADLVWTATGQPEARPTPPTPLRYDPNRARAPATGPAGGAKPLRYADRQTQRTGGR
jgi:hypothetical protein